MKTLQKIIIRWIFLKWENLFLVENAFKAPLLLTTVPSIFALAPSPSSHAPSHPTPIPPSRLHHHHHHHNNNNNNNTFFAPRLYCPQFKVEMIDNVGSKQWSHKSQRWTLAVMAAVLILLPLPSSLLITGLQSFAVQGITTFGQIWWAGRYRSPTIWEAGDKLGTDNVLLTLERIPSAFSQSASTYPLCLTVASSSTRRLPWRGLSGNELCTFSRPRRRGSGRPCTQ